MKATPRFIALDVFRGLAIAAMIMVNTPGSWSYIYWPLAHSDWHGCTPTDLIFPCFLFITGSAMVFAFRKYQYSLTGEAMKGIGRRVLLLFFIGLFLNWFGFWDNFSGLRVMGVLQRIGLTYGMAAVIVLAFSRGQIYLTAMAILLGYWLLLWLAGGAEPYSLEGNLVRQIDLAILGHSHMWHVNGIAFDPEGLLSTLPAVVTVLGGYLATHHLVNTERNIAMRNFMLSGVALIGLAQLWSVWLPINKSLWTGSFVLLTVGINLVLLVVLIVIVDVLRWSWFARPLEVYGLNPLFVYVLSWVFARLTAVTIQFENAVGENVSGYDGFYLQLTELFSPINASLAFALLHVVLFWLISAFLYRKNIVIKL